MTRAYPPSWFTGRLVSLKTRWEELNTPQASDQLQLALVRANSRSLLEADRHTHSLLPIGTATCDVDSGREKKMDSTQLLLVLDHALQRLRNPTCWTAFALARDKIGKPCDPLDSRAVSYCIAGAILRSAYDITADKKLAYQLFIQTRALLRECIRTNRSSSYFAIGSVADVNNYMGYGPVITLLQDTYARAKYGTA